jgi:hypothetical protein
MQFREKSEGGKNFVKLKGGESVTGLFIGELYEFRQHWSEGRGSQLCSGDKCEACKAGQKPSFRFRLNFIVKEGENYVPKVFEQGWTVYEQLRGLHDEYDLTKTVVKVARQGDGKNDTTYTVLPAKVQPSADVIAKLQKLPLLPLEHGAQGVEQSGPINGGSDDATPF